MADTRESSARLIPSSDFAQARVFADDGQGGPAYLAATDLVDADDIVDGDIENGRLVLTKRNGNKINLALPAFTESQDDLTNAALDGRDIVLTRRDGTKVRVSLPTDSTTSPGDFTSAAIRNGSIVLTRRDGTSLTLTLPTSAESRDDFTGARISGNEIILTRRNGTTVTLDLPEATSGSSAAPTDTYAQAFSILQQFHSSQRAAKNIPQGTAAGTKLRIVCPLAAGAVQDFAEMGLGHASGRISATNLHASTDTLLRAAGLWRFYMESSGAGTLGMELVEFDAQNNELRTQTLASHFVSATADARIGSLPVTNSPIHMRHGPAGARYTYQLFLFYIPADAVTASNGSFGLAADAETWHRISFQRWQAEDGELPAGAQAGQLLGFENGAAAWESIIKTPGRSATETRETYIRSTGAGDDTALSHQPTEAMPFLLPTQTLPARPNRLGQLIALTELDGENHPDFYTGIRNQAIRNEVRGTIGSRSIQVQGETVTEYGFSRAPAPNSVGTITQGRKVVAKVSWYKVGGITVFNIWLLESLAASRASIFCEVRSSETGDLIDSAFNRTRGILAVDGDSFRQYQGAAPLTETEVAALANIQDADGGNDLQILIFESAAGARGNSILFLDPYIWQAFLSQAHLRQVLEVARAQRQLQGAKIFTDWPLEIYASAAAAQADGVLTRPGRMVLIQPDRSDQVEVHAVSKSFPATDAVKGGTSERNRLDALMSSGSHGVSVYCDLFLYPSEKRGFENQPDGSAVDPQGRIGVVSLRSATADTPASIFASIDQSFHNGAMLGVTVGNRVGAQGAARGAFQAELTKLTGDNASLTRGSQTFAQYQQNLSAETAAELLGSVGWAFANRIGSFRFFTRGQAQGGQALNINPDTPAFTSGPGYQPGSDAVAARLVKIGP